MALITGQPLGNVDAAEDLYIEGAPTIFFQDYNATPLFNPDADGFYWNLSGTVAYPVFELGCIRDVSIREGLTMNDVRCDTIGVKDVIQRRDYVEFVLTVSSMFPLAQIRHLLKLSSPTVSSPTEKVGIGGINQTQFYMVYAPRVYNEDVGDYIVFHLHKAKFVDAWEVNFAYGEPWSFQVMLRGFADSTKPTTQRFGVIIRSDLSAIT